METHPSYDKPLDKDLQKEHRLHRLVAGSAFIFALSILPVAQYVLLRNQTSAPGAEVATQERRYGAVESIANGTVSESIATNEEGQVAGVTTDGTVSLDTELAFPADPAACTEARTARLSELRTWADAYKATKLAAFERTVKPYREALQVLTGDAATLVRETEALNRLIDAEYQPYLTELARIESAVAGRQLAIQDAVCGAPAQPVAAEVQ